MSDRTLPKSVNWQKLANSGALVSGKVRINELERLKEFVDRDDETVAVDVDFQFEMDSGYCTVIGSVGANVSLQCQRCLEPVKRKLIADTRVIIRPAERQGDELPVGYESFDVEDENLLLDELIEEEVLLSIPYAAYHKDCKAYEYDSDSGEEESKKENPFQVLEVLKEEK